MKEVEVKERRSKDSHRGPKLRASKEKDQTSVEALHKRLLENPTKQAGTWKRAEGTKTQAELKRMRAELYKNYSHEVWIHAAWDKNEDRGEQKHLQKISWESNIKTDPNKVLFFMPCCLSDNFLINGVRTGSVSHEDNNFDLIFPDIASYNRSLKTWHWILFK